MTFGREWRESESDLSAAIRIVTNDLVPKYEKLKIDAVNKQKSINEASISTLKENIVNELSSIANSIFLNKRDDSLSLIRQLIDILNIK